MYSLSPSTPDGGGQPQTSLANGLKERRQRLRPGLRLAGASWKLRTCMREVRKKNAVPDATYKEGHSIGWSYHIECNIMMYDDYVLAQVAKFICSTVPYMYEMTRNLESNGQGSIYLS